MEVDFVSYGMVDKFHAIYKFRSKGGKLTKRTVKNAEKGPKPPII